ncbi:MAG TPA: hypothetical protein VFE47_25920 [Tepidisphaeraceae bacterium]|jgi:hypothetical protein|nr:hypothetical protein [Tepidisphaeraceae bacterium]
MDEPNPVPEPPGKDQPPADNPLEHIVDDTEERGDCHEWIYRQFVAGRGADEILAELIGNGWPADDAEAWVEQSRRATRHLRGVITREGVARAVEKRSRKAFRTAFRVALAGIILVAITYGCHSLAMRGQKPPPAAGSSAR